MLEELDIYLEKKLNLNPYLPLHTKINSKSIMDLNVKPRITNPLEEKIGVCHDLILLPLDIFIGHFLYLEYPFLQFCIKTLHE